MTKVIITAGTILALALSATPCFAADDIRAAVNFERQTSAFAGANVRLTFGQRGRSKPTARLQLGAVHELRGAEAAPVAARQYVGLELGLNPGAKPELFLGGQSTKQIGERLNLGGSASNTVAIVFGVALVVVGVIVISNLNNLNDREPASSR